jgi:hypothetical protein
MNKKGYQPTEKSESTPPNCDSAVNPPIGTLAWFKKIIENEPSDNIEPLRQPYAIHIDLARDSDYHVLSEWEYKDGKQTLKRCTITKMQEDIT